MSSPGMVVKVGGSLFDLPDLGPRLRRWLDTRPTADVLLVPGGGRTADVVRYLDQCHRLGEETAHWLALRAVSLNAHFLAALLPGCRVIGDVPGGDGLRVLDAYDFVRADEGRSGSLPHTWHVTSDSVAARAAVAARVPRLILLKSINIPKGISWAEAARRGLVDPFFADAVSSTLSVEAVNFRDWQP
ncbi:MAG TPA: hypothetical protein VNK04_16855 [Gemmataceae bacterium]|nr:hypothetical protein [Gemmataceae bacterium]